MGEVEHYYCVFGSKPPQEATVPHAGSLIIKSVRNGSFITFGDGVSQSHKAIFPLCFFFFLFVAQYLYKLQIANGQQ